MEVPDVKGGELKPLTLSDLTMRRFADGTAYYVAACLQCGADREDHLSPSAEDAAQRLSNEGWRKGQGKHCLCPKCAAKQAESGN